MDDVVKLSDVSFSYSGSDEQVLDVSLTVRRGDFVVLTGGSGCGKTSITRLMNGLIPYFYEGSLSGDVLIAGRRSVDMAPWEFGKIVGSVFQDPRSQFFASIVEDEIAFACENYGMPSAEIQHRVAESARELGVESLLFRDLHTLSSGEKQRVAVAAVRAMRPEMYVMDEPSANLDIEGTQALKEILAELKAQGKTVIVAEHRLAYLMDLADRVLYMRNGRVEQEFTPDALRRLSREQLAQRGLRAPMPVESTCRAYAEAMEGAETLSVHRVSIYFDRRVKEPLLNEVSLSLRGGEVVALTGSNGTGKTTLARIICGLTRASDGRVSFNGREVKSRRRSQHAWFVMQDTDRQLFAGDVAGELTLAKKDTPALRARVEEVLTRLDLWPYRERHPASLSSGQRQRVTIAVALMQETGVLILDEPTSGLDAENMQRVADLLKAVAREGRSVLVITHDQELIERACSRVLHLG